MTGIAITYIFAEMRVTQFATMEEGFRKNGGKLEYDIRPRFAFDVASRELRGIVASTVFQSNRPVAKIEAEALFIIAEASVEAMKKDGKIVVPKGFLSQAASLCYGTERGILLERLERTPLRGTLLPPVYFQDLVTKELVVEAG